MNRRTLDVAVPALFAVLTVAVRIAFGSGPVLTGAIIAGVLLIALYWGLVRRNLAV